MLIEVYADVVCPWCAIGERRLARALAERPGLAVERRWRPFQLQPQLPPGGVPWAAFVDAKFGGVARAQAAFARVAAVGAEEGLTFAFDRVASAPNTVDAHRLILHAARHGREWAMADALFTAYFAGGADLNDPDQLVAAAVGVGLSGVETRAFLAGDEARDEVAASQAEAAELGVTGVPFFVLDGRYAVSGAQPVALFLRALDIASGAADLAGQPV
jgi:predicted DsbA family dithiol-disulfide isomerase